MRAILAGMGKVILASVAMIGLSLFFASLPKPLLLLDPAATPDELAEAATRVGWIGWARLPAIYLIAILVVATLSGLLFSRSRWVVRPAVIITVLAFCSDPMAAAIYFSRVGPPGGGSSLVRYMITPLVGMGLIAFLFAPFLHDLGRTLGGRLRGASRGPPA